MRQDKKSEDLAGTETVIHKAKEHNTAVEDIKEKEQRFLEFYKQAVQIYLGIDALVEEFKQLDRNGLIDPIKEDTLYRGINAKLAQIDQLIEMSNPDYLIPSIMENSTNQHYHEAVSAFHIMKSKCGELTMIVNDYLYAHFTAETFLQLHTDVSQLHVELAKLNDNYNKALANNNYKEADSLLIAMDNHFQQIEQLMQAANGEALCATIANSTNTELQAKAESIQQTNTQWHSFATKTHEYVVGFHTDAEQFYNEANKIFQVLDLSEKMLATAGPNENCDEIYKTISNKLKEMDQLMEVNGNEDLIALMAESSNPDISKQAKELQERKSSWEYFAMHDTGYGKYVSSLHTDTVHDEPAAEQVATPSAISQHMLEKTEKKTSLNLMQDKVRSLFSRPTIEGQCKKLDEIKGEIQTAIDKMQSGNHVYDAQKKLSVLLDKYKNEHNILNKLQQKNTKPLSAETSAKVSALNAYHQDNIAGGQLKNKHLPSLETTSHQVSAVSPEQPKNLTGSL